MEAEHVGEQSPSSKPTQHATGRGTQPRLSKSGESLYLLLDVEKTAAPEDIRRAYRKLALKYHPDMNQNSPEASVKFKEVNYANDILSDVQKRKIYDSYGLKGLHLAETIGEAKGAGYSLTRNKWVELLGMCCCILTGGCPGCCCCLCFWFWCFRCAPKDECDGMPEDLNDEQTEEANGHGHGDNEKTVLTDQPKRTPSWSSKMTDNIADKPSPNPVRPQ